VRPVSPKVFLVGRTVPDLDGIAAYLSEVGGMKWFNSRVEPIDPADPAEGLTFVGEPGGLITEFMGRLCYRSWEPGLNPNVTRIREDQKEYLANVLNSKHGSVLEHAVYNFAVAYGSRVFTHEAVRHRAGTAISQESMRFVRLDDLPFWIPPWFQEDERYTDALQQCLELLAHAEQVQRVLAQEFGLDDEGVPFTEKKAKTSFMRRFAPDGVATHMGWSANIRALRWIVQQRTELGAEEEIRLIFDQVAQIMTANESMLFQDFEVDEDGMWVPSNRKV